MHLTTQMFVMVALSIFGIISGVTVAIISYFLKNLLGEIKDSLKEIKSELSKQNVIIFDIKSEKDNSLAKFLNLANELSEMKKKFHDYDNSIKEFYKTHQPGLMFLEKNWQALSADIKKLESIISP